MAVSYLINNFVSGKHHVGIFENRLPLNPLFNHEFPGIKMTICVYIYRVYPSFRNTLMIISPIMLLAFFPGKSRHFVSQLL